jgi:glycosyltransferase involved in cell wall biosynthesis
MRKLVVFPNDPILAYYRKGEIKPRYFNPGNYFDEVHIISLCDEEVEEKKVQELAGEAKLKIHAIGNAFSLWRPWLLFKKRNQILRLVKEIKPTVIRTYNPVLIGALATYCGKSLNIPTVVSLHGNFDLDIRYHLKRRRKYKEFLVSYLCSKLFESYVLSNASKVICAYRFPVSYAKQHGAKSENIAVIYNRVYLDQFKAKEFNTTDVATNKVTVICVGRQVEEKNQECLIRAIKDLDVKLLLIGDGELHDYLASLTKELGIENKVEFIRAVPNKEISQYYLRADIFAIPIKYGGICIPAIEAMASALPIILPKPIFEDEPELTGDIALVVENSPEGFREAIIKLMHGPMLRKELGERGRKKVMEIDGKIMERKEMELYRSLVEQCK